MPVLPSLVRAHLRSSLPGRTRLTCALARRFRSLQTVPVEIVGCSPAYVDLRDASAHPYYQAAPHAALWGEELEILRTLVRPGDVAMDIGANRGFVTVLLASLIGATGRLTIVEPNPAHANVLRRTLAGITAAGGPPSVLLPVALGESDGELDLLIPDNHEMASFADWTGMPTRKERVRVRRLDALVREGEVLLPDVVKIDTEGAESLVVRGGLSVFDRRDAPVVFYEANRDASRALGMTSSAATQLLLALERPGYRCYAFDWEGACGPPSWVPVDRLTSLHTNVVAVPASRLERWPERP